MRSRRVLITFISIFIISNCEIIEIEDGQLEGTVMKSRKGVNFSAFRKIPYAEPPIGNLRFQPPIQNKKWQGILDAKNYGPTCMQSQYKTEFGMSEDCLHLNVFTKNLNSTDLRPVITYIHGGAFETGSGAQNGPDYLMDRDVVLVTINYRLGPFGFLAIRHKDATGNMGLKDQVMALKWIRRNIAKFGGNPKLVTITGLSAGGYSVTSLMASKMSQDLFHRVIAMSGAITWQVGFEDNNIPMAIKLSSKLNCSQNVSELIECLNKKTAQEIIAASSTQFYGCPTMPWIPVIEPELGQDRFFTDDPNKIFKSGNFTKVPVIIGITADEFIQPVDSLVNNETFLKDLNENFNKIAPDCFFFKGNGIKTTDEISSQLRDFYIPYETIDTRSFDGLNHFYSDGVIGYNVHRFVNYVSPFTDVYYYKFSYIGRFSYFYYPRNKPYGVHHADDNQYLFRNEFFSELIREIDEENFMVERMTSIWEQFAVKGNPNNLSNDYLSDMNWPQHNSTSEYYLDIGRHMIEKQGLFVERYRVWDNLENSSKSVLSVSFTTFLLSLLLQIKFWLIGA